MCEAQAWRERQVAAAEQRERRSRRERTVARTVAGRWYSIPSKGSNGSPPPSPVLPWRRFSSPSAMAFSLFIRRLRLANHRDRGKGGRLSPSALPIPVEGRSRIGDSDESDSGYPIPFRIPVQRSVVAAKLVSVQTPFVASLFDASGLAPGTTRYQGFHLGLYRYWTSLRIKKCNRVGSSQK